MTGKIQIFFYFRLFYPFKRDPWGVIQDVDDAALFKSVFPDQMLHDFVVCMCIDTQMRDLCLTVSNDLREKSMDRSIRGNLVDGAVWRIGKPGAVVDLQIRRIFTDDEGKDAVQYAAFFEDKELTVTDAVANQRFRWKMISP